MLRNVAPEVDSGETLASPGLSSDASPGLSTDAETKEFERSLWRAFRSCQALRTHVESIFGEVYSRYVARDICDEEVAYKLRALRGNCRVCYTNADREFHKAAEQIPTSGNLYKAYRAAAELKEQCDELMQLMTELDPDQAGGCG